VTALPYVFGMIALFMVAGVFFGLGYRCGYEDGKEAYRP